MEEDRLTKATGKPYGSTRRGIAPVYADKYMKKAFRMGELLNTELLYKRLPDIVEWKNMTIKAYGFNPVTVEEMVAYFEEYGKPLAKYVTDTGVYLNNANAQGKNIMFEAQLGAPSRYRLRHSSLYFFVFDDSRLRTHRRGRSQP